MKPIDTSVAEYLKQKMQNQNQPPMPAAETQPKFGMEEYNKAVEESQRRQSGLGLAQFASGIGAALAGRDNNSSDAYFDKLGSNIQDQTVGEFGRQKAMQEKGELSNPNSQKSQNFRRLAESIMPNIAKAYGKHWQNVTAADKDSLLDFGKMRENFDSRKQELAMRAEDRDREVAAKTAQKQSEIAQSKTPEARLSKLSGTDKARYDNALMVLKGIDEMGTALDNDQKTFSLIGDNDYTAASRRATEAYGRMQSGGAINKDEEKRFQQTLPGTTDSKEIQRKKLLTQREEMLSRLKTLGFTPEQIGYEPKSFSYGSEARKQPKTITQNGHTYIFNEATGTYE